MRLYSDKNRIRGCDRLNFTLCPGYLWYEWYGTFLHEFLVERSMVENTLLCFHTCPRDTSLKANKLGMGRSQVANSQVRHKVSRKMQIIHDWLQLNGVVSNGKLSSLLKRRLVWQATGRISDSAFHENRGSEKLHFIPYIILWSKNGISKLKCDSTHFDFPKEYMSAFSI